MTKRSNGKTGGTTLSKDRVNGRGNGNAPAAGNGKAPSEKAEKEEWVTLRRASEATGVSISTLRSWYRKGTIDSRIEKGPNGSQRIVRLKEVAERVKPPPAKEESPSRAAANGKRARSNGAAVPAEIRDVIEELAAARERAGRAEARADLLEREIVELRSRPAGFNAEHVATLEAENRVLRERLELLRVQAEDMARRLSAIDGEPDEIDLTQDEPAIPPEEEDEYLALAQRWKARRLRKKAARKSAKASRS